MTPDDQQYWIVERFRGIDDALGGVRDQLTDISEKVAVVNTQVNDMSMTWRSLRTAIYAFSGSVLSAAVIVLFIGGGH